MARVSEICATAPMAKKIMHRHGRGIVDVTGCVINYVLCIMQLINYITCACVSPFGSFVVGCCGPRKCLPGGSGRCFSTGSSGATAVAVQTTSAFHNDVHSEKERCRRAMQSRPQQRVIRCTGRRAACVHKCRKQGRPCLRTTSDEYTRQMEICYRFDRPHRT